MRLWDCFREWHVHVLSRKFVFEKLPQNDYTINVEQIPRIHQGETNTGAEATLA